MCVALSTTAGNNCGRHVMRSRCGCMLVAPGAQGIDYLVMHPIVLLRTTSLPARKQQRYSNLQANATMLDHSHAVDGPENFVSLGKSFAGWTCLNFSMS
uniref:Uncharacterized protein n=1 Tax=Oryza barthii TaxID=65489 RepID=A0A0D3GFB4_9ORYZ